MFPSWMVEITLQKTLNPMELVGLSIFWKCAWQFQRWNITKFISKSSHIPRWKTPYTCPFKHISRSFHGSLGSGICCCTGTPHPSRSISVRASSTRKGENRGAWSNQKSTEAMEVRLSQCCCQAKNCSFPLLHLCHMSRAGQSGEVMLRGNERWLCYMK